jgi:hypothetical protein
MGEFCLQAYKSKWRLCYCWPKSVIAASSEYQQVNDWKKIQNIEKQCISRHPYIFVES